MYFSENALCTLHYFYHTKEYKIPFTNYQNRTEMRTKYCVLWNSKPYRCMHNLPSHSPLRLLRLRGHAEVFLSWRNLDDFVLWEHLLSFLWSHWWHHHALVTLTPIGRSGNLLLWSQLEGIDHTQDFTENWYLSDERTKIITLFLKLKKR